jgi:predicted AlkP superfamily pyrophosphatase or phosphodiesterase
LRKKDKKYVFAYYPFIDVYSHKFGPYSDEVKLDLDKFILNLRKLLAIKDTLIILTADHGQTPVSKTLQINYNDEIMNYLELPPTGDSRFLYFYVKHNCKKEFVDLVKDKYSNFFEIYETRSLYPIFGKGPENIKI